MTQAGRAPNPALGTLLLGWRTTTDTTQAAVARFAGCSLAMVSHVERGRRRPGRDLAVRLEEAIVRMRRGERL